MYIHIYSLSYINIYIYIYVYNYIAYLNLGKILQDAGQFQVATFLFSVDFLQVKIWDVEPAAFEVLLSPDES